MVALCSLNWGSLRTHAASQEDQATGLDLTGRFAARAIWLRSMLKPSAVVSNCSMLCQAQAMRMIHCECTGVTRRAQHRQAPVCADTCGSAR